MELRRLIRDFQRGSVDGRALLRAFIAHPAWSVPAGLGDAGPAPALSVDADGNRWLAAFTDRDAMEGYLATEAGRDPGRLWLELPGDAVIDLLADGVDGWNVNPLSPDALHYKAEQLPFLRSMNAACRVERILRGEADVVDEPFGLLRDYDGWGLVMRAAPDGRSQLVLAPDERGRKLAAVFTAPDCLDTFVSAVTEQLGIIPITVTTGGVELFRQLDQMPIDGVVFNCMGPVPPKALAHQFSAAVLQGR